MKIKTITILDKNGIKEEVDLLAEATLLSTNKNYILYKNNDSYFAHAYELKDEIYVLEENLTEEERKELEQIFNDMKLFKNK